MKSSTSINALTRIRQLQIANWTLQFAILVWTIAAIVSISAVSAAEPLDPALPFQAEKSSPVTYDVDLSVVVTPPYHTHVLKVWLPVPPSDAAQEATAPEFTTFPLEVRPQIAAEPLFGNRFAYFEFQDPRERRSSGSAIV